jgi:opacity protein-like surface antigen
MARLQLSNLSVARRGLAALLAAGALALAAAPAQAQVPGIDFYMGAGLGQSDADISPTDIDDLEFDKKDMAWKIFGGITAPMFGAELSYMDFGKPSGDISEVSYKGLGMYGVLRAPLPVVDLFAKAGIARVDADLEIDEESFSTKDTQFAWGIGAGVKLGKFSLRAEYEQFKVKDSDADVNVKPTLLSVSFAVTLF